MPIVWDAVRMTSGKPESDFRTAVEPGSSDESSKRSGPGRPRRVDPAKGGTPGSRVRDRSRGSFTLDLDRDRWVQRKAPGAIPPTGRASGAYCGTAQWASIDANDRRSAVEATRAAVAPWLDVAPDTFDVEG